MKNVVKIIVVCAIFLPIQIYYMKTYHKSMSMGVTFVSALIAFGVAEGVVLLMKKKETKDQNPNQNQNQNQN